MQRAQLEQDILAFRRSHALRFLQSLAGRPPETRLRTRLLDERGREALARALSEGEIDARTHAACAAHMARAAWEDGYAGARREQLAWVDRTLPLEGEPRPVRALAGELFQEVTPHRRQTLLRALDHALGSLLDVLEEGLGRADERAQACLSSLGAGRHPDAGPEGGSRETCARFLRETEDLAREAVAFVARASRIRGDDGGDVLWALAGSDLRGLFPRDGRLRRLASDFDGLGLRRALSAHGRAAAEHPGPFSAAQLAVVSAPTDVRVSMCALEQGLASELGAAEGVGRALALTHASRALPAALRHPTVGSVSRAFGSLAMQLFTVPHFVERARGLASRERDLVVRRSAAYVLIDARVHAASVLARGLPFHERRSQAAGYAAEALGCALPEGLGAWLVTRLSPGGPARGKIYGLAIGAALRERFDDDWYRNPRAGEPLRGAAARAGDLSVESLAEELGADLSAGHRRLAELF